MFGNLTNFAYVRNLKEAIGFYIFYLILLLILAVVVTAVAGLLTDQENSFDFGLRVGNVIAVLSVIALSFTILMKRNLLGNGLYLILALLSGLLAYFGGGLLGLIPVVYLSTKGTGTNLPPPPTQAPPPPPVQTPPPPTT